MKKTLLALAAFAALSTSSMAFSQEKIDLKFSGAVTTGACNVTADATSIGLGRITEHFLTSNGTPAFNLEEAGSITLSDCSTTVDGNDYVGASLAITGGESASTAQSNIWGHVGNAEGVGVEIQIAGQTVAANNALAVKLPLKNGPIVVAGRIVRLTGATVKAGDVMLALQATLTYDQ